MNRFGEKLRVLRQQHGLTMQELASVLDLLSRGHVGDIEKGRKKPSVELAVRVALFFNVTTDQLLRDDLELD